MPQPAGRSRNCQEREKMDASSTSMRQHHKWIVKWFLCNTLLWQHSPMSGKQVSIKRVDMSIGKLASVWPMAFHCVSGHALSLSARMRFAANSLYHTKSHTISRSVKHKNGLDSFPIGRRLRECFPYTLVDNMRSSHSCNNFAWQEQCCNVVWDFAEWEFPAPAIWYPFDCKIKNWGRTILHLAGQVCGQLVDYVQSHWHKSTNLSVCTRLQPQLLRQLEVRFTRAPGTRLGGLEMSRSLNLLSFESQCDKKELQIASWNEIYPNDKFAQASFSSSCCPQRNLIHLCNKCTRCQGLPISK